MLVTDFEMSGLKLIEPKVYHDSRGYFYEAYHKTRYSNYDLPEFVQDNISFSTKGVFRGLHLQYKEPQAKLVSCLSGTIVDYAVDLRKDSPTFGKCKSIILSGTNQKQFFIPLGYAHGFYTTSETAIISYKTSDYYYPEYDITLHYSDLLPLPDKPILSNKDKLGITIDKYAKLISKV